MDLVRLVSAFLLSASSLLSQDPTGTKSASEEFARQLKQVKTPAERAALVRALPNTSFRDPAVLPAIAPLLKPQASDLQFLVPVAAAEALSRFRGEPAAAQVLLQARAAFRGNAYMQPMILLSLARVGHESAFPTFRELLRGGDPGGAPQAVKLLREMPAAAALDFLLSEWDWAAKHDPSVGERLDPLILAAVQAISGESYPSKKEFGIWWSRRRDAFMTRSEGAERTRRESASPSLAPSLPLIVELVMNDADPRVIANTGSSCAWSPSVAIRGKRPERAQDAMNWGVEPGPAAVDLPGLTAHHSAG